MSVVERDDRIARVHAALDHAGFVPDPTVWEQPVRILADRSIQISPSMWSRYGGSYSERRRIEYNLQRSTLSLSEPMDNQAGWRVVSDCTIIAVIPTHAASAPLTIHVDEDSSRRIIGGWTPQSPWIAECVPDGERHVSDMAFSVTTGDGAPVDYDLLVYVPSGVYPAGSGNQRLSSSGIRFGEMYPGVSVEQQVEQLLATLRVDPPLSSGGGSREVLPDEVLAALDAQDQLLASEGWRPSPAGWQERFAYRDSEILEFDRREEAHGSSDYGNYGDCWAFVVASRAGTLDDGISRVYNDHRDTIERVGGFQVLRSCVCGNYTGGDYDGNYDFPRFSGSEGPVRFRAWSITSHQRLIDIQPDPARGFCGAPYSAVTRGDSDAAIADERAAHARYQTEAAADEAREERESARRYEREAARDAQRAEDRRASDARLQAGLQGAVDQFGQGLDQMSADRQQTLDHERDMIERQTPTVTTPRHSGPAASSSTPDRGSVDGHATASTGARRTGASSVARTPASRPEPSTSCFTYGAPRYSGAMGTEFLCLPVTNDCDYTIACEIDFPGHPSAGAPNHQTFWRSAHRGPVCQPAEGDALGYDAPAPRDWVGHVCRPACDHAAGFVDAGFGSCECDDGLDQVGDVCYEPCPAGYTPDFAHQDSCTSTG